ncbi:hypothetical protein [Flavobacterium sp.]|uniref:hypothetical protein n=1 Tax=Flavobacterium sp. TaxID=239 RepID=UPI00120C0411|nr:hypothetical protein [Flavobacterium sp.]RZJ72851.1 MAG: hypothetical protein EOO49_04240 [Flavobacterium sp.]
MLTVDYDELKTAEELGLENRDFEDLEFYQGVPFTGLAVSETEHVRQELLYENGLRQGESKGTFIDGGKFYSGHYQKGVETGEHFTWNENGFLVEYENFGTPYTKRFFENTGELFYEFIDGGDLAYFYKNGNPMLIEEKRRDVKVFAPTSELAFTKKFKDRWTDEQAYEKDGKYSTEFNDDVLKLHFVEMAAFLEIRIDIFRWLARKCATDRAFAAEAFNRLIDGENLNVKSDAMLVAGNLGLAECLPSLHENTSDHSIPSAETDRVSGNEIPVTARISGMAYLAIDKIENPTIRTEEENESFWRSFFNTK